MQEKQCAACHKTFPIDEFRWLLRHDRGKDERFRDAWCRNCRKAYKRLPAQREKASARQWINTQLSPELREKQRLRAKSYYANNHIMARAKMREKGRKGEYLNRRLKQKFGIGLNDYELMHQSQGGKCKLCEREESTKQRRLAVDHCHATLKVRALLCHHCNTGLGNFKDNIELLRKAIRYLEAYQ